MPSSIDFDAQNGQSAKINYSVPLPGQNTGKRIIQLDLGLTANDFKDVPAEEAVSFAKAAGISKTDSGFNVDTNAAAKFLRNRLLKMGHNSKSVESALSLLPSMLSISLSTRSNNTLNTSERLINSTNPISPEDDGVIVDPVLGDPRDFVRHFANNAVAGVLVVPTTDASGRGIVEEIPEEPEIKVPNPQLFLIEVYGVSSFLGDYGMGKTVKTFTLLPGESTTIKLKTWQSTKESIAQSSSIIDSSEQSAKERFSNKVQNETTDKKTKSKTEKWSVEAEAKASWGWGSASVKAGAEGEYHSGREQFAKSTSESVGEHAKEASSKRELSVTSSTETETEFGEETSIERVINNVNMRRVLNFVFRELNQEYTTKFHLKGVYIGFTNELLDSWRQVPISGLHTLLDEVMLLDQAKKDEIAKLILKIGGTVFNNEDLPVRVLEHIHYDPFLDTVDITPAVLDANGEYDAPNSTDYYRFKIGSLGQGNTNHPVDGVLLSEQTIVMRTDSVIVEALLGQADALDNYSMEIQEAAARKETLANEREELLLSTIQAIADPDARAKAAAAIYNTRPKTVV